MRKRLQRNTYPLLFAPTPPSSGGTSPTPPSIIDTTSAVTSGNTRDLDVSPPAGLLDGHIWMIIFATDSSEAVATPVGWSRGAGTDNTSGETPTAVVLYKTAGASESLVNVTWGTIEQAAAYSIAIGGGVYDTSTVDNISVNGTDIDSPAITVAENGSIVLQFGIGDDNNVPNAAWNALPSGSDIGEGLIRSGFTGGVFIEGVYDQQDAGAATVGSWVMSTTRARSTLSVSINPN